MPFTSQPSALVRGLPEELDQQHLPALNTDKKRRENNKLKVKGWDCNVKTRLCDHTACVLKVWEAVEF